MSKEKRESKEWSIGIIPLIVIVASVVCIVAMLTGNFDALINSLK